MIYLPFTNIFPSKVVGFPMIFLIGGDMFDESGDLRIPILLGTTVFLPKNRPFCS